MLRYFATFAGCAQRNAAANEKRKLPPQEVLALRRPSVARLSEKERRARTSAGLVVADDTGEVDAEYTVPGHKKSKEALERIAAATVGNTLFDGLTSDRKHTIA